MLNRYLFAPLAALFLLAAPRLAHAQTGSVGIGTTAPAASAALDVSSTSKGLLPPRMTTAQRDAITSPAAGLTIYNTTTNKLNTWNGSSWDTTLSATEQPYQNQAVTFGYTGVPQTYIVPAGVTRLAVDARGAGGGSGSGAFAGQNGGAGARVQTTLSVTPGQQLLVLVGGAGGYAGGAGFNGAVPGSYNGGGGSGYTGGAGGGASDVRSSGGTLADRLVVAAGGGGGGNAGRSTQGGVGGAPNGGTGTINNTSSDYTYGVGGGATQTGGGTNAYPNSSAANGGLGQGGTGGYSGNPGGGGGGGYYGGAGGGGYYPGAPGGGGSSWVAATASATTMTAGDNAGNGVVVITPGPVYTAPALDGSNFVNVPGPWQTSGSNVYRASGNVGIGTSSPGQKLEVNGTALINTNYDLLLRDANHGLGYYGGSKAFGTAAPDGPVLYGYSGGALGTNQNGTRTTALYWNSNGNVGIGTNPVGGLHIDRPEVSSTALGVTLGGGTSGNPSLELRGDGKTPYIDFAETSGVDYTTRLISQGGRLNVNGAGSTGILLDVNGGLECTGLNNVSDRRLKQHIRPLIGGLAAVLALRGVRYDWNPLGVQRGGTAGTEQIGVIAQEVEAIFPELVNTGPDGFKSVNYVQLAPAFIEAFKEQQQQIETLKQQNAALQGQAKALETRTATAEARAAATATELRAVQTQAAQATATLDTFEARLRRLEAGGEQARK